MTDRSINQAGKSTLSASLHAALQHAGPAGAPIAVLIAKAYGARRRPRTASETVRRLLYRLDCKLAGDGQAVTWHQDGRWRLGTLRVDALRPRRAISLPDFLPVMRAAGAQRRAS